MRSASARHSRRYRRHLGRPDQTLQRDGCRARRRRHEDQQDRGRVLERGTGSHASQDARGHEPRHPRHRSQAGGPSAQHAHSHGAQRRPAHLQGARDDGDLRAARQPPGHELDQVGARGPVIFLPRAREVPAGPEDGERDARGAREVPRPGHGRPARRARRGRAAGCQDLGQTQAPVLHLPEDVEEGQGLLRDLRPDRSAHHRRHDSPVLQLARGRAQPVAPDSRTLQGLHRDAQVQHVPVAAHDGHGTCSAPARDPDPHRADAPHERVRHRRALALQGRRRLQEARCGGLRPEAHVAARDARLAAGDQRPPRVHGVAQGRPVRERGLLLHAQRRGHQPARVLDAARLCLRDPHRGGQPLHRS